MKVDLDGRIGIGDLVALASGRAQVELGDSVQDRVRANRSVLEYVINDSDRPVYGVTTGLGDLVTEKIPEDERHQMQANLVRSHSAGVGKPLSPEVVRAIIALRVNSLGQGYSGVRMKVIDSLVELLNKDVIPYVPEKGSLGASGDLIPLAHVASVLIGEGKAYYRGDLLPGAHALERAGIDKVSLMEKEGLALINGTQAMTAVASLCVSEARKLLTFADIIGGLTTFLVGGNLSQYDSRIYELRPYKGQQQVANNLQILTGFFDKLEGSREVDILSRLLLFQDRYPISGLCYTFSITSKISLTSIVIIFSLS